MKVRDFLTEQDPPPSFDEIPLEDHEKMEWLKQQLRSARHKQSILSTRRTNRLHQRLFSKGHNTDPNDHDPEQPKRDQVRVLIKKLERDIEHLRVAQAGAQQNLDTQLSPRAIVLFNTKGKPAVTLANPVGNVAGNEYVGPPEQFDWSKAPKRARGYYEAVSAALARNGFKFTRLFAVQVVNENPTKHTMYQSHTYKKGEVVYLLLDATKTIALLYFPYMPGLGMDLTSSRPMVFKGAKTYSIGRFLGDGENSQDLFLKTGTKRRGI